MQDYELSAGVLAKVQEQNPRVKQVHLTAFSDGTYLVTLAFNEGGFLEGTEVKRKATAIKHINDLLNRVQVKLKVTKQDLIQG